MGQLPWLRHLLAEATRDESSFIKQHYTTIREGEHVLVFAFSILLLFTSARLFYSLYSTASTFISIGKKLDVLLQKLK